MVNFKSYLMAVILGIALAFASVVIVGYGAAVSVPAEILKTLTKISDLFAFVVLDFFTIAVPLAVAFLLLAYVCKFLFNRPDDKFYLLLLAPLVLLNVYFLLQLPPQLNVIVPMLRGCSIFCVSLVTGQ
ncbi:hypothetical protein, partial [Rheinheimera nanhaiensis]|uniref:hypothetical protein n=1 Tax=Rheinheimera nanhaiensis TaxID=1163621 RepID=UPI000690F501